MKGKLENTKSCNSQVITIASYFIKKKHRTRKKAQHKQQHRPAICSAEEYCTPSDQVMLRFVMQSLQDLLPKSSTCTYDSTRIIFFLFGGRGGEAGKRVFS